MILSIKEMTPEIYNEESRDFQLLCNIYTCLFNGVKGDVDSITNIVNTKNIMSTMLSLLKSKLGFESEQNLNDDELRYILQVFPYVIRAKGSQWAIKEMINMCLKLYNVAATFKIEKVEGDNTVVSDITLDTHSILIGIDTVLRSTSLLQELCDYVMPPGFTLYVYFYTDLPMSEDINYSQNVELLYSSDNINSLVRSWEPLYDPEKEYRFEDKVRSVDNLTYIYKLSVSTTKQPVYDEAGKPVHDDKGDLVYIIPALGEWPKEEFSDKKQYSVDDKVFYNRDVYRSLTTQQGPWNPANWELIWEEFFPYTSEEKLLNAIDTMYIGSTESQPYRQFKGIVKSLSSISPSEKDVAIEGDTTYYYNGDAWKKLSFAGAYINFPDPSAMGDIPEDTYPVITIVPSKNKEDIRKFEKNYFRYDATQGWIKLVYRGSISEDLVYNPRLNNMVATNIEGSREAKYFDGTSWQNLNNYLGAIQYFPEANPGDYVYITSPAYYMYTGNETTPWIMCSGLVYTLDYFKRQG